MKHRSIILILAFLLIAFPVAFKAQSSAKSKGKKIQKVKRVSDEAQAKKIVEQVIDGFFVKREFLPIFQNFFSFAPCDKIDKDFLDQNCNLKDLYPIKFGKKIALRTLAMNFRSIFLEFYFVLGTIPINKDSQEAYPYSSSDYDVLESEVLKKNKSINHDFDFLNLSKNQVKKRLDEIERNLSEVESLLFKRIDRNTYNKNLRIMKETIIIGKEIESGRKYYGAGMKGLIYGFILSKRKGQLKIVGITDGI